MDESIEKYWWTLQNICRDFYFKWRAVVEEEFGKEKSRELVAKFWEKVGIGTAKLYIQYGKVSPNDLLSIAKAIKMSSTIMGEDVEVEIKNNIIIIRHISCPWWNWYKKMGLEEEDQYGCDKWFEATVKGINPRAKVETVKSFPKCNNLCERRIVIE